MWKYYLDESRVADAIINRMKSSGSTETAMNLLRSLGYENESVKCYMFEDLIFSQGTMDETYSSEEIDFCENLGNVFASTNKDMFDFFLVDICEEDRYDAFFIGSAIKLINKAFKGRNVIIFQCKDSLMFAGKYVSKFRERDFHFTFWMRDVRKIMAFSAYSLCKKNPNFSYALYMSNLSQMSLFRRGEWNDKDVERVWLEESFIALSKKLEYIKSKQIDSFELLDKALQATKFIKTDKKMDDYRSDLDEDRELVEDEDYLFRYLKE